MTDERDFCWACHHSHLRLNVQIVGGTLYRRIRGSKHIFRNLNCGAAIAFTDTFYEPHRTDFTRLEILDTETKLRYVALLCEVELHSFRHAMGVYGQQVIFPLEFFHLVRPDEQGESTAIPKEERPIALVTPAAPVQDPVPTKVQQLTFGQLPKSEFEARRRRVRALRSRRSGMS